MTTDNKTLAVDVLAVMLELDDELQSAANYSGEGCYWSVDDDDLLQRSAAARAAVAELIEAVDSYRSGESFNEADESWSGYAARRRKERDRVDVALARVKGVSA